MSGDHLADEVIVTARFRCGCGKERIVIVPPSSEWVACETYDGDTPLWRRLLRPFWHQHYWRLVRGE